ncbi:MAG: ribosome maturation factor RimM [Acidimicrobiales bacterium]
MTAAQLPGDVSGSSLPDTSLLEVGRVLKPHGLKGNAVVELFSNRSERLEAGAVLICRGRRMEVRSSSLLPGRPAGSRWLVCFVGVDDVQTVESMRGATLLAQPLQLEDALWVHELVGSALYDVDGDVVGEIAAVQANPASDLLVLGDGRLVPLTFVSKVSDGKFVVDPPAGLLDL